jgi:hypothetical protein
MSDPRQPDNSKLSSKLEDMSRSEVVRIARRLSIGNIDSKSRPELVKAILAKPAGAADALRRSKWSRLLREHIYGVIGVLVGVVGIILTVIYATRSGSESRDALQLEVDSRVADILAQDSQVLANYNEVRIDLAERPDIDLKRLDYSGFELLEERIIWDLREWKEVPTVELLGGDLTEQDLRKHHSAATVISEMKIRRISEEARSYKIRAQTSGYEIFSRCQSHPENCVVVVNDEVGPAGGIHMKDRLLEVDVSQEPVTTKENDHSFWIKTTRTYWNAFQRDEQTFVGTIVRQPIDWVDILVIVPEEKPIMNFELMKAQTDGDNLYPFNEQGVVLEGTNYIYWKILKPTPGWGYRLDWGW